jgi:hypothetical protein
VDAGKVACLSHFPYHQEWRIAEVPHNLIYRRTNGQHSDYGYTFKLSEGSLLPRGIIFEPRIDPRTGGR